MMENIFLETTINADRHFQTIKRQMEIRENLKDKRISTSNYVIGELKNNFLRNSITFYNLLLEENSTLEALKRLGRVLHSSRQFDRVIKVFSYLAEKVGYDKEELMERLDILIEDSMEDIFIEDIDEIISVCNCIRSKVKPKKEGDRWVIDIGCRQSPRPQCNIVDFITDNIDDLKKIAEIEELKSSKMVERLEKMLDNEIKWYGQNCWYIGDSVIGIESPKTSKLYTTNKSDFVPICKVLDKELYQE